MNAQPYSPVAVHQAILNRSDHYQIEPQIFLLLAQVRKQFVLDNRARLLLQILRMQLLYLG